MYKRQTQTSQIDEPDTLVSVETEKVTTSISTRSENKPDDTAALMQLLLHKFDEQSVKFDKLDKKLDEQKSDSNIKYTNLNDKFEEQSVKFDEIKNEIKIRNDNLNKQCDKAVSYTHLDVYKRQCLYPADILE